MKKGIIKFDKPLSLKWNSNYGYLSNWKYNETFLKNNNHIDEELLLAILQAMPKSQHSAFYHPEYRPNYIIIRFEDKHYECEAKMEKNKVVAIEVFGEY